MGITSMDFAASDAPNFEPQEDADEPINFLNAIDRDPIALLRSAIRNVSLFTVIINSHCLIYIILRSDHLL